MTHLSNLYYSSPVKNNILLFNGHASHFGDHTLRQMMYRNIQPFARKAGDSTINQPNDNGTNVKLKYLYNELKAACIMKCGTEKYLNHHMNYILEESWNTFNVSAGNIISDRFVKTKLPPPPPSDLST